MSSTACGESGATGGRNETAPPEPDPQPLVRAWDQTALCDPHGQADKGERIRAMFNAIAPTYERFNTIGSLGRDAAWRRRAVAAADVRSADVVLDVACGTGDMLRTFARATPPPARLIGVDFARDMLARGRYDGMVPRPELIEADALALPLADESVDVISCAFGVRNFQDVDAGLREMWRVARRGARVVILEFTELRRPIVRSLYRFYCERVLPVLGTWLSRDRTGAYHYLPRSVATFDTPEDFTARLRRTGFARVTAETMNLGGVALYRAEKPAVC